MQVPKRLKKAYSNMNGRCYNPKTNGYKYYGGKGVIVCNEWLNDRNKFYEWALENGYENNLTLDRIKTEGNYEPNNCRWITHKEQQSNRTNNIFIEVDGEVKTISRWSQEIGIGAGVLKNRVNHGEKDIFKPVCLSVEIDGKIKALKDLSIENNIPYDVLKYRYDSGWDTKNMLDDIKNEMKLIKYNEKYYSVSELAKMSNGLTKETILMRISYGWKNEDLLKPLQKMGRPKKYIEINGEFRTKNEWCEISGISPALFYKRMKKGITGNDLLLPINKNKID